MKIIAVKVFQLKQLKRRNLKKFRLERESNPWPLRYRCSALTNQSRAFPLLEMFWPADQNKQLPNQSATLESPDARPVFMRFHVLRFEWNNPAIFAVNFTFITACDWLLAETLSKHLLARNKLRRALVKRLYEGYFSSGRAAGCGL